MIRCHHEYVQILKSLADVVTMPLKMDDIVSVKCPAECFQFIAQRAISEYVEFSL